MLQGSNCSFAFGRLKEVILPSTRYHLVFHYQSRATCTLPAENLSELQKLLDLALKVICSATQLSLFEQVSSISVQVQAGMNWLPQSAGSAEIGWSLKLRRIVYDHAELVLIFGKQEAVEEGLGRLRSAMARLDTVVRLYRKVNEAYDRLEHHNEETANRLVREGGGLTDSFPDLRRKLSAVQTYLANERAYCATGLLAKCRQLAINSLGDYSVVDIG